jgi:hypothetical protein
MLRAHRNRHADAPPSRVMKSGRFTVQYFPCFRQKR